MNASIQPDPTQYASLTLEASEIKRIDALQTQGEKVYEAARYYASIGLYLVPLRPNTKQLHPDFDYSFKPDKSDKLLPSKDPRRIDEWFHPQSGKYKNHNLGIAAGKADGAFILDIDVKPEEEKNGYLELAKLEEQYGKLPPGPRQKSASGGAHLLFRWPQGLQIARSGTNTLGPGIDTRGGTADAHTGHIVAFPSRIDGQPYDWQAHGEIPACPPWVLRLLANKGNPDTPSNADRASTSGRGLEETTDEDYAAAPSLARIEAALQVIDPTGLDYDEWLQIGMAIHSAYPDDQGLAVWDEWSADDPDRYKEHGEGSCPAKWKTFKKDSGVTIRTLFYLAKQQGWCVSEGIIKDEINRLERDAPLTNIKALLRDIHRLDPLDQARHLKTIRERTGFKLADLQRQMKHATTAVDQNILAMRVIHAIGPDNILSDDGKNIFLFDARGIWRRVCHEYIKQKALDSIGRAGIPVTANLVRDVTSIVVTKAWRKDHQWNVGNPEAVSCPNGLVVLDNTQWVLKEHRRDDYRTNQLPANFNPKAQAPKFNQFLDSLFDGDDHAQAKKDCILQMMGYSLMSHCRYETWILLIGEGSNGKSRLLKILEALVGKENRVSVQPSQLGNKFQRAELHGKLINIVTELGKNRKIPEEEIKSIASGEASMVEHKNQSPFESEPYSTFWFGSNHEPQITDETYAFYRRARIIEFNNIFHGDKKVIGIEQPIIEEELEGILALALNAYSQAIADNGIVEPQSSLDLKESWQRQTNPIPQFIEDRCETVKTATVGKNTRIFEVSTEHLYEEFQAWAYGSEISCSTWSEHKFSSRFHGFATRFGFEKSKVYGNSKQGFKGIALKLEFDRRNAPQGGGKLT